MQGERLGPYQIDRELGAGGMGKVYAATVADHVPGMKVGAKVALKLVHAHLLESPGFFKRFMREAEIGRTVQHPNVVSTFDADALVRGGVSYHFLVMELVEGQTLRAMATELERVPEELCRHIGREICKGLAAIHEAGVVHRDLKPENVLITPQHEVKVMDLGVARLADEAIRLSRSGAFVGSVEYGAPEQFSGAEVDSRCDLHALGLVMYEIAAGRHPYRGDDFRGVMRRICDEEPRRLGELNPQISQFFEEVVHTLLAKQRDDRFASATAMLEVLDQGEDSEWWHARARAMRESSQRPLRRIRIPRETGVHGRDDELARLRTLFGHVRGGEGRVVLLEGEAGIGKSRLVDELVAQLQQDGEDVNFLFGCYPPGAAAAASGGFSTAFREHFGEGGSGPCLAQTPLLVPAFDAVLRGEPSPTGAMELTRESLGTCFVHAARNLAAERPTVILIDDLHFAPEEARGLFSALALSIAEHRVLLVGTTRPGLPEEWLANLTRLDQAQHMQLNRLTPKDLAGLLEESLGSKILALELGMQVTLKSDGNPFFVFEILRGLREGQFITRKDDGTWVSTRVIDQIQIPSSVMDLVNARVANLDEDERNLLDVASCLGFEFDPLLAGDVLGLSQIPLMRRLAHIEKKHRLVRSAGRRFAFDHHQVQESLYAAMPELLREPYHAALADALERRTKAADKEPGDVPGPVCVDLCEHFLSGVEGERALRYLEPAVKYLAKGHLQLQAAELLERALASDALDSGVERARQLVRLARVLSVPGRIERMVEASGEAEQIARDAGDELLLAKALHARGSGLVARADYVAGEECLIAAIAAAEAAGDREIAASATSGLANACWAQSRLDEADAHARRAAELADGESAGRVRAGVELLRGNVAWSRGRYADARRHYERSHELAVEQKIPAYAGLANVAFIDSVEGHYERAREGFDRAIRTASEQGDRAWEAHARGMRAWSAGAEGRLGDSLAGAERAMALARESSARVTEMAALGQIGGVHETRGHRDAALEHVREALELARRAGLRLMESSALGQEGSLLCESGEREEGEQRIRQGIEIAAADGNAEREIGLHLSLASVALDAADSDAARAALDRAQLLAGEDVGLVPGTRVRMACLGARLPGGDVGAAVALVDELGSRTACGARMASHHDLWLVTGETRHLIEARRALDFLVAHSPEEHHESMLTNVRLHREIMDACREHLVNPSADADADDEEPRGTESVTRVE